MLPMLRNCLFNSIYLGLNLTFTRLCGWEGGARKQLFFKKTVKRTLNTAEVGEFIFDEISEYLTYPLVLQSTSDQNDTTFSS
jgi:hypothetical protein